MECFLHLTIFTRMSDNKVYKFRFNMSQDGTKRIQPKRQTLDDAYSPPGREC